jgi:hypothetical protein
MMRTMTALRPILGFILLACSGAVHGGDIVISGVLTNEFVVAPGGAYEGTVEVQNPNDLAQEVRVYQTDYLFSADGVTLYGDPGSVARSNAKWISIAAQRLTIPPHQDATVAYKIRVPANSTLAGTYWSVIMVEPLDPEAPDSSAAGVRSQAALGVRQVLRYAVQVVTHVGDTGSRLLKFAQVKFESKDHRVLLVDAVNNGERWLRGRLWIDLYKSDGSLAGHFEAAQRRMYPGTSVRYGIDLGAAQPASYKALLVIDCGGDDVFGASINLVLGP